MGKNCIRTFSSLLLFLQLYHPTPHSNPQVLRHTFTCTHIYNSLTHTHIHTLTHTPQEHPHTQHPQTHRDAHATLNWRGTFAHADIPRLPATYTFTPLHIQTHTQTLEHRCRHTDSLKLCVNIYIHTHTYAIHEHILAETQFPGKFWKI